MSAKSKGYTLIVVLLCAFALTIYGAYSTGRKAQKQQIVCIKFKKGVGTKAIEQHMYAFASLKHEIPQIINYTSGQTISSDKADDTYDVVHYLTFQSEEDIKKFEDSPAYKQFVADNRDSWEKTLTVNANIR